MGKSATKDRRATKPTCDNCNKPMYTEPYRVKCGECKGENLLCAKCLRTAVRRGVKCIYNHTYPAPMTTNKKRTDFPMKLFHRRTVKVPK